MYGHDKKLRLTLDLGNDAMQTPEEIADALHTVADSVLTHERGVILDLNGNAVGVWRISR